MMITYVKQKNKIKKVLIVETTAGLLKTYIKNNSCFFISKNLFIKITKISKSKVQNSLSISDKIFVKIQLKKTLFILKHLFIKVTGICNSK